MKIKLRNKRTLSFEEHNGVLLSSSIIMEKIECPNYEALVSLKEKINGWFHANAYTETLKRYTARLPYLDEVLGLDEIPYQGYWLGDKRLKPIALFAGKPVRCGEMTRTGIYAGYGGKFGVRLALVERKGI